MSSKKKYYRKRVEFFRLLQKMKLWPSRSKLMHGIKTMEISGNQAVIVTHCNEEFTIYNSKNSRAARFLRNHWGFKPCPTCRVPFWKLEKYESTRFNQSYGSDLSDEQSGSQQ